MKRFYCFLFLLIASACPAFAQSAYQAHTHVELISEEVPAGKQSWVGINFKLDQSWHIYWQNPGDSGLPPKIKWNLPDGVHAGAIQWPYPHRLNVGPLTSYGYDHEVLLLVPITVDAAVSSSNINLQAHVDWLACSDVCIPGRADLSLPLMISDVPKYTPSKVYFDQTRHSLPQLVPSITSRAVLEGNQWHLDIETPSEIKGDIAFYPFRDDVIEHAAPQETHKTPMGYQVILTKSHLYQDNLKVLEGIAVNDSKAILIQAPVEVAATHIPFLIACLFAFIGGLILNLMPCVLPVLSIKVLHLVERHPDKSIALRHSLLYSLGILFSVWILAGTLFILKSAGEFAGWGFQFQSPVFVVTVALILFISALNLFGLFEFSAPAISGIPKAQAGYQASFISGVITTIVASPCTAPFMGTAITLALNQPNIVGFGIFTFLGLGLASPFVCLSAFPSLLSFIPKPGPWMLHLKRMFGLILIACVIWLLWVFGLETGLGDLSKIYKPANTMQWQVYSPSAVMQARQSGHGVFIDFTAAWCINCQVNDRLVLQNPTLIRAFKDKGIIAFKADWTKYDPVITRALASYGRDSIPVYVYYPPNSDAPVILPQLITSRKIIEQIK